MSAGVKTPTTDVTKRDFDERLPEDGGCPHATDYSVKMADSVPFHLDRSLDVIKETS